MFGKTFSQEKKNLKMNNSEKKAKMLSGALEMQVI